MVRDRAALPCTDRSLDRLLAMVWSARITDHDIMPMLQASAGEDEPPNWSTLLKDPQQRQALAELLSNLTLLERSSLGTPAAQQMRGSTDTADIFRVLSAAPDGSPSTVTASADRAEQQPPGQATLPRRCPAEPRLTPEEIQLLAQIASGVTADMAAKRLELSARTLRRRLRTICDRLEVGTPIEAVVWAARRQLI